MNCPTCGSENAPNSRFCEDCGAQLSPSGEGVVAVAVQEGPIPEGQVAAERFRVERLLEEGRINRYQAVDTERENHPTLLLESLAGDSDPLSAQWDLLKEVPQWWSEAERIGSDGRIFLAGPLPGEMRLEDRLKDGSLPPQEVLAMGRALAGQLSELHERNLLHLALQPSRVWLGPEQSYRLDPFDRTCSSDAPPGNYSVTAGFSPPEAYGMQGGVVDRRSDLFSLGAVLHYALTGERPDLEARESFFSFPRPRVDGAGPLAEVIMKAVAKAPSDRYESAADLLAALETVRLPADPDRPALPDPGTAAALSAVASAVPARSYRVALRTDIGCVRSINQDACGQLRFTIFEKDVPTAAHLVVVADGMGGEAEGDKAASLAVRSLLREVLDLLLHFQVAGETNILLPRDPVELSRELLQRAIEQANRVIHEYAQMDVSRRGMGCTLTAVMLCRGVAVFGHVGDTRGYLFSAGRDSRALLDLVTTDHSLVGRLVQMGQMTREEARTSPQRSIIYRAMGTNPDVEVDLYERRMFAGQYLLVCSDGVWEYYEDGELEALFGDGEDPEALAEELVQICISRGADDNATCAVIRAEE